MKIVVFFYLENSYSNILTSKQKKGVAMTFPTGGMLYTQGFGSRPENVEIPTYQTRAPTTTDTNWPIGKRWIQVGVAEFSLLNITSVGGTLSAVWSSAEGELATNSVAGTVFLGTLSQLQNGNAPSSSYVPSTNDVATVIAGIVVGAVPPANTAQAGIVFLADSTAVVSPWTSVHGTNVVVPIGQIQNMFAAPPTIGNTTPATGAFTTLAFTTATGTAGGTWATGGTAIQIGHDVTNDAISIGDLGARTITIGHASGAAALNLAVGSGNFSLDGVAASTYAIGASTTTGTITIGGTAQSTGAITLGSSTAANSVLIQNGINTGAQITSINNGANAANSTVNILNGIATSGTQTLNVMNTTAAATAQVVNILSGANTNTTNTINIAGTGATGTKVTTNIGTGAAAHVVNIGVTSGASQIAMLVGTGNFSLDGAAGSTYTIGASTTTGTITIGGSAQSTGAITVGNSSATNTLNLGIGNGANTTNISSGTGGNTVSILNGATASTSTVNILSGAGSAGGGALHMADNGRVTAVTLANVAPAAARAITIAGGNAAQNDVIAVLGGANTAGTQSFSVLNGALNGSTNTLNLYSGVIASGTQTFNLFNGNASGGTLVANIFGSAAATTAGTVNINTGAAAHVLNVGSATAGNATITLGAASTNAIVGSGSTLNIVNDNTTNTINIGAGATGVNTITLGTTNSTSGLTLKAGTGNFVFTSVASMTATMFAANTTGAITIGGTAQSTGAITVGNSSATNTLNLGIGNGANTTNISTGTGGNTIHIGDGAGTNTITIGNAASVNTVALGSTNSTSTTTISGGTGVTHGVQITGGPLVIATAAQFLAWKGGAVTDFRGTGVLTAGTQTIANTNIATGDMIFITRTAVNASTTLGEFTYTISNGASFTVTSVILGTPGSTQTGDVSSYAYIIVRPV